MIIVEKRLFKTFTAMWMPIRLDKVIEFSDRRAVFKKIREMVE